MSVPMMEGDHLMKPRSSTAQSRPAGAIRRIAAAVALAAALVALSPVGGAAAQVPTGVTVDAGWGIATVAWGEVAGATSYEIERTHLIDGQPAGPGAVVGIWTPTRGGDLVTPGPLTFADSGFAVGERYSWRVRGIVAGVPGAWSDPVAADLPDHPGPEAFLTGFELSDGERWTTHQEEVALVAAIAAASDRVRLETIGTTLQGRPIQLAVIGDGAPGSATEIAAGDVVLISGTVHGTERSGREGAMMFLRHLAFSNDPWVEEILAGTTVLLNPTLNPDGMVNATRGNTTGQDLNRDHLLLRNPENFALAKVIRDYQPDIVVDSHENPGRGGDMEFLWPRSRAVEENLFHFNQSTFARGYVYNALSQAGLSPGQWGTHRTDNWETLLSNAAGLKNTVGLLQEVPSRASAAHPAEGATGTPANQRRRAYAALWNMHNVLDIHHDHADTIQSLRDGAEAYHTANSGPLYIDGAYDIPVNPPPNEPPTTVFDGVCGYRLDAEQFASRQGSAPGAEVEWISETVEDRLAAHGVTVEGIGGGIVDVRLAQPLRPLIPFLLDPDLDTAVRPEGTPNISMVEAERLDDDRATVFVRGNNTRVANRTTAEGCSINDLIADEQQWPDYPSFVAHVTDVVDELLGEGIIDDREAVAILRRVTRSR